MAGRRMPASLGFAPKLRLQTHFPRFLDPRALAEKALAVVVQERT